MRSTVVRWSLVGAGIATLAAGCGAATKAPPVARIGAGSTTRSPAGSVAARRSGVLYASCMRAHGLSSFPDAAISVNGGRVEFDLPAGMKDEPAFATASRACARDLPGGAAAKPPKSIAKELAYARCMRAHGVADFPDPLPGGGFDIPGNTSSQQFQAAEGACRQQPATAAP